MSPTEGGEGSPARSAATATTRPHGASRGCSAKRKAARDPASGRMPRPRATGKKAGEAAAADLVAAGEQWKRLSKGDIRWILSRKPLAPPAWFAALKRSNPALVPRPGEEADEDTGRLYRLAKAFYEMEERLPGLQEWVRGELERKGCVELDDESAKRRAEAQAVVDREWPAIEARMKALVVSEREYRRGWGGVS